MSVGTEARAPEKPQRTTAGWSQSLHDWVTTVDHKRLGILYIGAGFFFLVVGGVEANCTWWCYERTPTPSGTQLTEKWWVVNKTPGLQAATPEQLQARFDMTQGSIEATLAALKAVAEAQEGSSRFREADWLRVKHLVPNHRSVVRKARQARHIDHISGATSCDCLRRRSRTPRCLRRPTPGHRRRHRPR